MEELYATFSGRGSIPHLHTYLNRTNPNLIGWRSWLPPFAYFITSNFSVNAGNHAGFQRRRRAERQGATAETMAGGASALAHYLPSNMLPPAEQNSAGITTGGSTLWLRMPSLASLACTPAARLSPFHPKLPNGSGSRRWRGRLC